MAKSKTHGFGNQHTERALVTGHKAAQGHHTHASRHNVGKPKGSHTRTSAHATALEDAHCAAHYAQIKRYV